ncbi:MAG: Crp/Fnr family transcriptional regulator [Candidatus Saccharibacteria bacterium]
MTKKTLTAWQKLEQLFIEHSSIQRFHKKELILNQGATLDNVYMIGEGVVRNYDINDSGQESTISFLGRYNIFPLSWLQSNAVDKSLFYYESFRETICYVANRAEILEKIHNDKGILTFLTEAVNKAYINHTGRILNLMHSKLHERVEYALYYLAVRLGEKHNSIYTVPYPISHEDIAKLVGASREAVSLELAQCKKSGYYKKVDHCLQIDVSKIDYENYSKQLEI